VSAAKTKRVRWTGVLLACAALLELAARTTISATAVRTIATHSQSQSRTQTQTQTLRIGHTALTAPGITFAYLLALAATLPPAFLPPTAAAVLVCAANLFSITLLHNVTIAGACVQLLVLWRLGAAGSRKLAPGLSLPFLILALVAANPQTSETGVVTTLFAALGPAAALAGLARRERGETRAYNEAQEAIASTVLEHTARGERARIARELHDVVAHHISMIAVQAETARLATPGMPEAGARRLREIGDTARAALTEMRRLLGVLREDARDTDAARAQAGAGAGAPAAAAVPERRPQPGLEQLYELLDEARGASGTGVRLLVAGSPVRLDPGVELAAYRIIQEALTNARRHAPGAAVDVELHYDPDVLRLRVRDNGPGTPPTTAQEKAPVPTGGHGLLGMRERAAAVGGVLRTGPADLGGYLVEATLPAEADTEVVA
jgi:signal transduction histidine kinase